MNPLPGSEGLSTDQAPPMAAPFGFFFMAPVAMVAAGTLLLVDGSLPLVASGTPYSQALTHLGTLGLLGSVMLGALYQMTPVVAGAPVPATRLAHFVQGTFLLGTAALVVGLRALHLPWLVAGGALLTLALVVFWFPVAVALVRAPTRSETVTGMRLALVGLALVAVVGVTLAGVRAGVVDGAALGLSESWLSWRHAHLCLGLVAWVGALLTSVSHQVLPMFFLAEPMPRWGRVGVLVGLALSTVTLPLAPVLGFGVAWAALPGAVGIWAVHPVLGLRALRQRRRKRADPSLRFWMVGLATGPLVLLAGGLAWQLGGRWAGLFVWLAVWGWAGSVLHGMLYRIVPFLVWFHRFSALVGLEPVPPMRRLLPDARARAALWVHGLTTLAGVVAVLSSHPIAARLTGVGLAVTGVLLAVNLGVVVLRRS